MNEHVRAFRLDPEQVASLDDLNGLTVSFGPQVQMLDVKAALVSGNGIIVAENSDLISALRGIAVLQEVKVENDATVTEVNVGLEAPVSPTPVGVIPQGAPPSELRTVADDVPAEHAVEGETVSEVISQGQEVAGNAPPVDTGTTGDAGNPDSGENTVTEPTSTSRSSRASR